VTAVYMMLEDTMLKRTFGSKRVSNRGKEKVHDENFSNLYGDK
jgi:hypothetical protein